MKLFKKKWVALLVSASVLTTLVPTARASGISSTEENKLQDAETVYVGFIKDGERSTLFNQDWRFYKGE